MSTTEGTREWVEYRNLKSRKGEIKENARRTVETEMNNRLGPVAISRKTGLPLATVSRWMILNRQGSNK